MRAVSPSSQRCPTYGGEVNAGAEEKRIRLRYAGVCPVCGIDLPARSEAIYERTAKTVRCVIHDENAIRADAGRVADMVDALHEPVLTETPEAGVAGASRASRVRAAQGEA